MPVHQKKIMSVVFPPNAGKAGEKWSQGWHPGGLSLRDGVRQQRRRKLASAGIVLFLLALLAACSSGSNTSSNGATGTHSTQQQGSIPQVTASAVSTPQPVVSKSISGTPGRRPIVITSPTPVSGGKPGSQQIVLADRTLIIISATRQKAASANSTLISLFLTVRNTSAKAIMNLPAYFQLMGSGGDTFGYQYNSSDNFYGTIAAHTNLNGMIVFEVPAAAVSGLRLLYHPEVATETAIIPLQIT